MQLDNSIERYESELLIAVSKLKTGNSNICFLCDKYFHNFLFATHKHHMQFQSTGGSDNKYNIVNLCPNCHAIVHRTHNLLECDNISVELCRLRKTLKGYLKANISDCGYIGDNEVDMFCYKLSIILVLQSINN